MTTSDIADESADGPGTEILWRRLLLILEEAAWTIVRTAVSSAVNEAWDFSCVLWDRDGRMIAQNTTISGKIGVYNTILEHLEESYPRQEWQDGDIYLTNDPWVAEGHLYDVNATMPIFVGGEVVAFATCIAHMSDIGGSRRNDVEDLYSEGLIIPLVRIFRGGSIDPDVMKVITANVRMPNVFTSDLRALISSLHSIRRQTLEFIGIHTLERFAEVTDDIIARTERAMRARLAEAFPEGRWENSIVADGGGQPITLHVVLERTQDGGLLVDFSASSPQQPVGVNLPTNFAFAWVLFAIKALVEPGLPNNHGSFAPITLIAPEGSVMNPRRGAAVRMRGSTAHLVPLVIFGAAASAGISPRIAESGAPLWIHRISSQDDAGRQVGELAIFSGGMGARDGRDGPSCMSFPGNMNNTPVEILEELLPLRVLRKQIRTASGGIGTYRGGDGQEVVYQAIGSQPVNVLYQHERTQFAARGLDGGGDGALGEAYLDDEPLPPKGQFWMSPGAIVRLLLPGGGGIGTDAA